MGSDLKIFKELLINNINSYNNTLFSIKDEEDLIVELSEIIEKCKNDVTVLPFFDENKLSKIFSNDIFDYLDYTSIIKKLKIAKYLIENSEGIDIENFQQYKEAMEEVNVIFSEIQEKYEMLVNDDERLYIKNETENLLNSANELLSLTGDDSFNGLIKDTDFFESILMQSELSDKQIDDILSISIASNLNYLKNSGTIVEIPNDDIEKLKKENDEIKEAIDKFNKLLDSSNL